MTATDNALVSAAAGAGAGAWLVRWLVGRAVGQVDAALLHVGARFDKLEATQHAQGEQLAVVTALLRQQMRRRTQ